MIPPSAPSGPARTAPPQLERAKHDYLAFVDGLRAVSILAVVGFHVGLAGFPGGFVGVDIFFVISGFLIINQIKDGLEAGRFSIVSFFARRALRIVPPFLVVVLATLAVAPFVLSTPTIYQEFMRQAAISPLMLSNFLFYSRQGYFDLNADEKPFLHTWTLSIEEQFYLLAPLILVLLFRFNRNRFGTFAVAVALALFIASLLGAIAYTVTDGRNPAFYFPHLRAWEFIAGGLITRGLAEWVGRAPRWVIDAIALAGLALMVGAIAMFEARMPFPSWRAAIPVAGAVLVILAGLANPQNVVARLLSIRVMVGIGMVSYAWYLWHWPILSYLRILRLGEPSLIPDLLGGGVLAFLLACWSYWKVELPVRQWRRSGRDVPPPNRLVITGVVASLAVAGLGLASGYAGYRLTGAYIAKHYQTGGQGELNNGCLIFSAADIRDACFEGPYGLLLGDSHAQAFAGAFTRGFHRMGTRLVSVARPGCPPIVFSPEERKRTAHGCRVFLDTFEKILAKPPEFVILASLWPVTPQADVVADLMRQFGPKTRILLMGPVPIFNSAGLDCVVLSDRYGISRDRCVRSRAEVEASRGTLNEVLKAAAGQFGNVRYADPTGVFCDAKVCRPYDGDRVYFRDLGHVLPLGAEKIFDAFRRDFVWLATGQ